jgi:uncharacterized membrane protein YdbT with pleckstrin-like domain
MLLPMTDEQSLWKGSSSQWLNLGPFAAAILLGIAIGVGGVFFPPALVGLLIPLIYMLWKYWAVRTQTFELTTQRLRVTSGIINQTIDEIELYRVKDSILIRTWWMRLTGLASIHLETSDRSMNSLILPAIPSGIEVREQLRAQVELQRDRKRVREMDFEELEAPLHG